MRGEGRRASEVGQRGQRCMPIRANALARRNVPLPAHPTSDASRPGDRAVTATDRLAAENHLLRCRWFLDRDLVLAQRRVLPCAFRATAPAGHSFLPRSAARNRVCCPGRAALFTLP